MRSNRLFVLSAALALGACASTPRHVASPSSPAAGVKVGKPYQVLGKTYVPHDDRAYDQKGVASWYGPTFHTKPTANGEIYNQDDVTAAHKTLPMPSWVEVTNLDNGRKLVVRINDRGPFVDGRIIDLSRRSAQLLGVDRPGTAQVRVRRVYPPEDWARTTAPLARQVETAQAMQPVPVVNPAVVPPTPAPAERGTHFVQVVALSDRGRAEWLAQNLNAFGPSFAERAPNGMWRVRLGPFAESEAATVLHRIQTAGYADARVAQNP